MNTMKEEFDHYLAGIAWNSFGKSWSSRNRPILREMLIQPEELIILTAIISKYDPRLRDEALDWSSHYHEFISVSRLRTFLREMNADAVHSFHNLLQP